MLVFTPVSDKELPQTKRMLWGGVREDIPKANGTLHNMTKETFFRSIMDTRDVNGNPILPCLIAWEKANGEERYVLVTSDVPINVATKTLGRMRTT